LLLDPSTRGVTDVQHVVAAVGSSSSVDKAKEFIRDYIGAEYEQMCRAYGSYDELLADPDVEIVYVASPQSHHYDNVLACLRAGKHVCCEKPFTINAPQTAHLIREADARSLFLMEAVWTRFFPITLEIQRLLHKERVLGKIHRVTGDFSLVFEPGEPGKEHRLFRPELGGGALLDLGVYPLTWAFMVLYQSPENQGQKPVVSGSILKNAYGVDEFTTANLVFPGAHAVAVATSSLSVNVVRAFCVAIQGEKGDLLVHWPPYRPDTYTLQIRGQEPVTKTVEIPGQGLFWEADACARAIRDGQRRVELCKLEESLLVMEAMDEVRRQNSYVFPAPLEDVYE